jgi:hypothetical protein
MKRFFPVCLLQAGEITTQKDPTEGSENFGNVKMVFTNLAVTASVSLFFFSLHLLGILILFPLTSLFKAGCDDRNYDSIMGIGSTRATTGRLILGIIHDLMSYIISCSFLPTSGDVLLSRCTTSNE